MSGPAHRWGASFPPLPVRQASSLCGLRVMLLSRSSHPPALGQHTQCLWHGFWMSQRLCGSTPATCFQPLQARLSSFHSTPCQTAIFAAYLPLLLATAPWGYLLGTSVKGVDGGAPARKRE